MKTEEELYSSILIITMKINKQYPELSKYILEMPITIPNLENPVMNCEVLQEYYDSLRILLKDHIINHTITTKLI